MKTRKTWRTTLLASLLAACSLGAAHATSDAYPSRPVRLVVPFVAGGTTDVIGRIVAEKFAEKLGQPFVADNRAGANTVVGSEIVARATADGHTLLIVSASIAVNPRSKIGRIERLMSGKFWRCVSQLWS